MTEGGLVRVEYRCEVCGAACATVQKAKTKCIPRFCTEHRQENARKRFEPFTDATKKRSPEPR